VCEPIDGVVTVSVAVEGDPETAEVVPTTVPSTKKLTVPVAEVPLEDGGVMVAVSCSVLPALGVVVAGVTTTVGVLLVVFSVTAVAVEEE
jgi:hypothetical protein